METENIIRMYENVLKIKHKYTFSLKSEQVAVMRAVLTKHDCFGLLPTGFGKNICYSLLPLLLDIIEPTKRHISLVISPLVSLIADQCQDLGEHGIECASISQELKGDLSGCVSERMQQDLVWNRTVNLRGGARNNDEVDLVNEFLNKEFKESLRSAGHQLSDATLDRHSKLAGGVGHVLDKIYSTTVSELESFQTGKSKFSRRKDIETFVRVLKDEELLREIPGRYHRAYQNFRSEARIKNTDMYISHINKLSRKFDKRNKIIANS